MDEPGCPVAGSSYLKLRSLFSTRSIKPGITRAEPAIQGDHRAGALDKVTNTLVNQRVLPKSHPMFQLRLRCLWRDGRATFIPGTTFRAGYRRPE